MPRLPKTGSGDRVRESIDQRGADWPRDACSLRWPQVRRPRRLLETRWGGVRQVEMPINEKSRRFLLAAVGFELALGALAMVLGWLFDFDASQRLIPRNGTMWLTALAVGGGGALCMYGGIVAMDRHPRGPLVGLRRLVRHSVAPLFRNTSVVGLALISLSAGWGEELLFRGLVQDGIAQWLGPSEGPLIGLLAASVLFGLCHWLSPTYAVVTALIGLVLGASMMATGSLLAPMVMHALYDFLALCYLVHQVRPGESDAAS